MSEGRTLSRDRILDATLAIIDVAGIAEVSARAVGRALGVRPMAIYYYFPSMDALLDAVVERVLGLIAIPVATGDTRGDLLALQRAYVAALQQHPRAIPLLAGRRFNAAGTFPFLDAVFGVLRAAGLDDRGIAAAFRIQGYFLNGALMAHAATLEADKRSDFALNDPEFLAGWPSLAPVVPFLAAGGLNAILEEGMSLILDGLEKKRTEAATLPVPASAPSRGRRGARGG